MEKIRTIIIDDEPKAIDVLERYCNELDQLALQGSFRDPILAIEFINANPLDLILLDINMPKINGMQLLEVIDSSVNVIFTTAYSEFALDSYDYNAVDYLLKPITLSRFMKAIGKVEKHFQPTRITHIQPGPNQGRTIYVKSGPQLHKIQVRDILYLEKDGNYLIYHTKNRKILARQNIKDVFEILDPNDFVRIHKSFVIAKKHVDIIEATQIKIGENYLPIGRHYKNIIDQLM